MNDLLIVATILWTIGGLAWFGLWLSAYTDAWKYRDDAGSCSGAVAARFTQRRWVGFELREEQCEAAARRLAQGALDFDEEPS